MREILIRVTGKTPLLMHNVRLANPMDPATKELNRAYAEYKRTKTDAAFEELSRVEFQGSLYYDDSGNPPIGPYMPTDNFIACLRMAGAKVKKTGSRATLKNSVAAALLPAVDGNPDVNPLSYRSYRPDGMPAVRTLKGLLDEPSYRFVTMVRVGSSKVARTRPVFSNWKFEVSFILDTDVLDTDDLRRVLVIAGQVVGLGDWRPAMGGSKGRFEATAEDRGEVVL